MKKIAFIFGGLGFTVMLSCNEPATFDQATLDTRADSLADARLTGESEAIYAEFSEMCSRQLDVLQTTRDSLDQILMTASTSRGNRTGSKSGGTGSTGTSTTPPQDPEKNRGGATGSGDQKSRGGATQTGEGGNQKSRGGATKQ